MSIPQSAVVLGSGAGALSCAVELSLAGVSVTLADFPKFAAGVQAVAHEGGIRLRCPWHGETRAPVAGATTDPKSAVAGAPLIVVSVPAFGHQIFADLLTGTLTDGQSVLWVGEGGGALTLAATLRRAGRRPSVDIAETNSLPYGARVRGPALITASRKAGGTRVAGLPVNNKLVDVACEIWPWLSPAENVWETTLLNFNAIDHVPPIICNLGAIEGRTGAFLLWGEGATPAVSRVIEKVDDEILALRGALGLTDTAGYADYLVEQGFAPKREATLHATLQASSFSGSTFPCGPGALSSRYLTEDVPYALVLMASLGDELGVATPTIDSLIHLAGIAAETDFAADGRTLADFDLAGAGRDGLIAAVREGQW
ncbi:NAD/NADP-dependent octopine/nopaline dehydrogenase family protein [Actinoallomurus oryzae]|uniref:NAD/NADP-dependent octopine/nopaline dehydrogenase family protein n=1 Tax=Actinoallomurus oryzae TaxID=502180 RepID=A0ABP8Q284_9ACTN